MIVVHFELLLNKKVKVSCNFVFYNEIADYKSF